MPLMKTADFAHFCRTTKETLFHYDRIGLLKPARVTDSGYRLYRPDQFFFFSVIALLQQADMPLADIRRITETDDECDVLKAVEERTKALRDKSRRLEAAEKLMTAVTEAVRETLALPRNKLTIIERSTVPLRYFLRAQPSDWTDETSVAAYAACYDWDEAHGGFAVPPAGEIVKAASLQQGRLMPDAIYSPQFAQELKREAESGAPEQINRAAGCWAALRRRVTADEMPGVVAAFLTEMELVGLKGMGDVFVGYEYNYLFPGNDPDRFDVVISRQIGCADVSRP